MQSDSTILAWLKQGLSAPGKSQRGLARALSIDPACVTRMLQGQRRLRPEELAPAASYLGTDPPSGWANARRMDLLSVPHIDLSPELRAAVFEKSGQMRVEPTVFVDRAVRAALLICGPI